MGRESWLDGVRRLDREGRGLSRTERLGQGAGLLVGFLGLNVLLWTRQDFPSGPWWTVALVAWFLVFVAAYAYLVVWLVARSRRRRRA